MHTAKYDELWVGLEAMSPSKPLLRVEVPKQQGYRCMLGLHTTCASWVKGRYSASGTILQQC